MLQFFLVSGDNTILWVIKKRTEFKHPVFRQQNILVVSKYELQLPQKKLLITKCPNKNMSDEVQYR